MAPFLPLLGASWAVLDIGKLRFAGLFAPEGVQSREFFSCPLAFCWKFQGISRIPAKLPGHDRFVESL
jgi:hypothetical protein